jgi:uroporphyrinogen decarboxylase
VCLTHKERMRRALWREPVDRLPTQINTTHAMGEKLAGHLGVGLAELPARLDNHLVRVDVAHPRRTSEDGRIAYDWWGVGWSTETEGYWPADSPLATAESLEGFPWPDPHNPRLMDEAKATIDRVKGEYFIAPNLGFCLFERAWSLRGFENFLMDLALNAAFAEELLERITEIQVALARRFIALGVDGGYFGDDYGAQKSLLFSPHTWRSMFKPRLARMFAVFREAGLPVILHSDGDIAEILPDLVEIGLTVLNPVQPEVLDHTWLKHSFGDRLAFYGGVSIQTVMSQGTPLEVDAAVKRCAQTLAGDGTGLVIGPSHRMTADIPLVNVDALLTALAVYNTRTRIFRIPWDR